MLKTGVTKTLSVRFLMLEGEKNLIQGAQKGDQECFGKLYDHYIPPIYRFIYMKVSEKQTAEDITHEVFLSAWQNIRKYQPQGFPLSSWLYQIARNRVIDYYRVKKHHTQIEVVENELEEISSVEGDFDNNIAIEKIKGALKYLTSDQQDVVLMKFMDELTHQEIAAAMKKSAGAVRLIQHRAINELRKRININETSIPEDEVREI